MDAVKAKLGIRQDSVLSGDHQIVTALPLADGLSSLKAGMLLYKAAGGYTPLPASYTTSQIPTAILLEDIDGATSGTSALCAIHGAVRAEKLVFADKTAVTSAAVEILRGYGIYAIGRTASVAQTPSVVVEVEGASVSAGAAVQLLFGVNVADGGSLTYQWYKNTTASATGGTAISGATASTYDVDTSEAGSLYFYCVATNTLELSTASKTSAAATVTVA